MPNLPIRGLGSVGVVTDVLPYDLPNSAWSYARNLRFDGDSVYRSSVFKPFVLAQTFSASAYPVAVIDDTLSDTVKSITTLKSDGKLSRVSEGAITDVSPSPALAALNGNATTTTVGQVSYVNTPGNVPISFANGEVRYSAIPNWTSTDRCVSLRSFRDFLIALNVTKDSASYPNMVKWSDAVEVGTRPSWDVSDTEKLAGENVINNSSGMLVDGMALGNAFLIYGTREAFRMDYVGAPYVFTFEKVFDDFRIMTQNCIASVGTKHYVFREDDIVVTDGVTWESICDSKVRRHIFDNIDFTYRDQCRVIHNSFKSEIMFCYSSLSSDVAVPGAAVGCNEAAVFNYANNTWSFIDLPNVTCGVSAMHPVGSTDVAKTWDGLVTWDKIKFNWSFTEASPTTLIFGCYYAGTSDLPPNVYFYDDDIGGRIGNATDKTTYWMAWGELSLEDFDAAGFALCSSKMLRQVTPQLMTGGEDQPVNFYVSPDMLGTLATEWGAPIVFNPFHGYKFNCRCQGRYISIRFEIPAGNYAKFSGMDLDIIKIADR